MAERIATLGRASSIVLVVFVTIGGIYLGLFTPIEASGFGASFTLLVALVRRKLSIPVMKAIVLQTMRTTATVFLILMGAYVFIPFMTLSELPEIVVRFLLSFDLGTTGILIIIILTYLALGTFMEDFSMLILTLPVVLPVLKALGVDLVWRGGGGPDHPDGTAQSAGRHQCLHREGDRAGRADVHDLSRHLAVLVRDGADDRPAADLPAARAVPAQHDVRTLTTIEREM